MFSLIGTPTPNDERWRVAIPNKSLALRSFPMRGSRTLGFISEGTPVKLIESIVEGFDCVAIGNTVGFISIE